jgi:hypothetical protein
MEPSFQKRNNPDSQTMTDKSHIDAVRLLLESVPRLPYVTPRIKGQGTPPPRTNKKGQALLIAWPVEISGQCLCVSEQRYNPLHA